MFQQLRLKWLPGLMLGLAVNGAWAQQPTPPAPSTALSLKHAFEAAWARQPEALSLTTQQEAAQARRDSANSWFVEPPALEVAGKTDQLDSNRGSREYEVGIAVPIWLSGERSSTAALATAEIAATASRARGAQLRTAAAVRTAYWDWQRARVDVTLARAGLENARELAADVAKRIKAGDLARADQHQADGVQATAEAAVAEAESALADAAQQLRTLTGIGPERSSGGVSAPEPVPSAATPTQILETAHPAVAELRDRVDVARRTMTLASVQGRANPELSVTTTRERGASGESWEQTVTLGLRIPLGSGSRSRSRVASANAEAIEAEAQLQIELERLLAETEMAHQRVELRRQQVAAAERRSDLAQASRGFFEKAFRLGEADLPTRLRIEFEAAEAERERARARIDLAAAISAQRQALGLLPE